MEIPKVYKALIEVDGRLESVIAGLQHFKEFKQLIYKEGEITYAPEGSIGIFVYKDIDGAKNVLRGNKSYTERGLRVIHEATPLGKRIKRKTSDCFEYETRYPAILLGKEVWRDKPREEPRPEPKFKVGDRVCFGGLKEVSTIKSVEWLGNRYAYHFNESSHFNSEEYLSLAPPKEEWVDITDEVKLYPYKGCDGILVSICDGEPCLQDAQIWLGSNGAEKIHPQSLRGGDGNYKIEATGVTTSDGCAYFRIFKKVVK